MIKFITLACFAAVALGGTVPGSDDKLQGFIVGGKATDIKEAPYTVSMLVDGMFFCGGTIVKPTVIVTAAHCAFGQNPSRLTIRAGSSKSKSGGVEVKVKSLHVHPKYMQFVSDYDVAVLVLEEALEFSETVKSLPLATSEPKHGESVKAVGYGRLSEGGPLSENLQSVEVPTVDRETCNENYELYRIDITERMLCAGVGGKDSCQGDSGGPLVHNDKLTGVVSFGVGCARPNLPGVYARVSHPEVFCFLNKYMNE